MKKDKINYINIESLINKLELKDAKLRRAMRRMQIMFIIFIFFYAALFLVNPDPEITINDRIAGVCFVIAFTLLTFQFRKFYRNYKLVNYSDSVKKVLEDAEKRYRLWQRKTWITIVSIILVDAASILVLYNKYILQYTFWQFFAGVQLFFILILGTGFTIGYIRWRIENRLIWLSAKKLLKELEE